MLLLLTTSMEDLTDTMTGYVWQFALRTFNFFDQSTKWERELKNNKLRKTFAYICLIFVQDENQDKLMQ